MKKNDSKGILEANHNKKNEKHPDYIGKLTVNNIDYNLAAWNRISKNTNKEYISIVAKTSTNDDPNYGALFINTQKVNKQPDRTGNIKINNIEYFLSAWDYENNINLVAQLKEDKSNIVNEKIPPESISSQEVINDTSHVKLNDDNVENDIMSDLDFSPNEEKKDDIEWSIDDNI